MHLIQSSRWAMIAIALVLVAAAAIAIPARRASADDPQRFTFGLWGDVPYAKANNGNEIPAMLADMNAANLTFSIYDGDLWDGSTRCDNSLYADALGRFNSMTAPVIYVVGDNEWTDCHRTAAGSFNPLERLDYVRKMFFNGVNSLGKTTVPLEHQGAPGQKYSETTRYIYGNVMIIGLAMPGSNNNYLVDNKACIDKSTRTMEDCLQANFEAAARDAANIDWLKQSFAIARQRNLAGVMIVGQADPGFDVPETPVDERSDPSYSGYTRFVETVAAETQNYAGQVVYVHGDTHFFKVDKPLAIDPTAKGNKFTVGDNSRVIPNFTRIETFGSANIQWVKVTVDPTSRNVFVVEPMIVGQKPQVTPAATPTPTATATATPTATPKP